MARFSSAARPKSPCPLSSPNGSARPPHPPRAWKPSKPSPTVQLWIWMQASQCTFFPDTHCCTLSCKSSFLFAGHQRTKMRRKQQLPLPERGKRKNVLLFPLRHFRSEQEVTNERPGAKPKPQNCATNTTRRLGLKIRHFCHNKYLFFFRTLIRYTNKTDKNH